MATRKPKGPSASDRATEVTARIVEQLEAGTAPWVQPWTTNLPANHVTNRAYSGTNVLALWGAAIAHAYPTGKWLTYKQAAERGAQVRKGEHGSIIFYVNRFEKAEKQSNGTVEAKRIPFLRCYTVFNVAQVDGLPADAPSEHRPELARITAADDYLQAIGAEVRYGGDTAFFSQSLDRIQLPHLNQFENAQSYYATALHEHGHWSGAEKRLNRQFGKRFGDDAYAFEELVAELTSAFLCAELEIEGKLHHPEYLAHWIRVLKAQPSALWTAGSKATEAMRYLHKAANFEQEPTEEVDEAVEEAA